jgi:hypothetical protein
VGASTLADVGLLGDAVINLSAAHPSGIASLYAGRPTLLSNIIRDVDVLPSARRRARAVAARSARDSDSLGLAPTSFAVGVATWTEPVDAPDQPEDPGDDVIALAAVARKPHDSAVTASGDASQPVGDGVSAAPDDGTPDGSASGAAASDTIADDAETGTVIHADFTGATPVVPPASPVPTPADDDLPQPQFRTVRAPVVLRPVALVERDGGDGDFTLALEASAEINPVVARTLRAHGALLDAEALAATTLTDTGFNPDDALARIEALGKAVLADFRLDRTLLVGAFVHPEKSLVDDLDALADQLVHHEVVAALAGVDEATAVIAAAGLPAAPVGDPDPGAERGAGDLDPTQRHVIEALATGGHLYVDAPIGSDIPGTVAAVIAEAAAAGRSVLYVSGHRRATDNLAARLTRLNLDGLLLDVPPSPTGRHQVSSKILMSISSGTESLDENSIANIRDALVGARGGLSAYITALHAPRYPWNVSAYDALQALARLTSERPTPSTQVRLPVATVCQLTADQRAARAADLQEAAELGAFTPAARATGWHEANLTSDDAAAEALTRVRRLGEVTLPQLRRQIAYVTETTGLTPPASVHAFADQLAMLAGMRGTLDVFQPMVFERSAADMLQATAPRKWRAEHGVDMSSVVRRRLRKRARDMLRPGVRVDDLHAALAQVQSQREAWATHSANGGWPVLPEGLATIEDTCEAVRIDCDALEPVLASTPVGGGLLDTDLDALSARCLALAADDAALVHLPRQNVALRRVRQAGLGDLIDDFAARQVPVHQVECELDLAWWSSVFEQILASDQALAGHDGASLDNLVRRFRDLDARHIASLSTSIRAVVKSRRAAAMRAQAADVEALYSQLVQGQLTSVRQMASRHGGVLHRLVPALAGTPTQVPALADACRTVDLVVLDGIEHTPLQRVISAVARGRQIVVIGDHRRATTDAVSEFADVLPTIALAARPGRRDTALACLLARHGYAGSMATPPMPAVEQGVAFDLVDGRGMPNPTTGTVCSTPEEVARVVDIVIDHALTRPEASLGIVALTSVHAARIREALASEVRANPALEPFFDPARSEAVTVVEASEATGLIRDTIVLAIGLGRTPHGRVLHRFAGLAEPRGAGLLCEALGAVRHRLHVVSCLTAADLDPDRLRTDGSRMLAEVLTLAAGGGVADAGSVAADGTVGEEAAAETAAEMEGAGATTDRLLADLGERLWRMGYTVETDYGLPCASGNSTGRIPLVVGHPDLPGQMLVAVLTDDAAYTSEPSIRVRDRQLPGRLESLGWVVTQVWSAAVFLDPDGEADRVRWLVQKARDERMGSRGADVTPRDLVVPLLTDADLA